MAEIYLSTDVEADGPIPGQNSMLSFASAAFRKDKELISTFEVNLECLEGAAADPDTIKWWSKHSEAWDYCRTNPQKPEAAMKKYAEWIRGLPGDAVFVGYPASYDFLFVYWYLRKYVGQSPFSHAALDIKTLAMVAMRCDYRKATRMKMPEKWSDGLRGTHKAIDDAIAQGVLFCNILAELELA